MSLACAESRGFIILFPLLRPELAGDAFTNAAAASAFIGGSVFEIGSYLMVVEALDRCVHDPSAPHVVLRR